MSRPKNAPFGDDFRRFFTRGLAAVVPSLLTIAILIWVYQLVNGYIGVHITRGLILMCSSIRPEPAPGLVDEDADALEYGTPLNEWDDQGRRLTIEYKIIHQDALDHPDPKVAQRATQVRNRALWEITFRKYRLHLLGFLIAVIVIYFTGFFLASFIGRTVWRASERLLMRVPLIRAIYPHVKQVTDFVLAERKRFEASGVVAAEYPRKGMWSLGLSTGAPIQRVQEETPDELVTVFIPSSPTPITGYVIQVPRKDVIELDMSLDEAIRFAVSAGVIKPGAYKSGDSSVEWPKPPELEA